MNTEPDNIRARMYRSHMRTLRGQQYKRYYAVNIN